METKKCKCALKGTTYRKGTNITYCKQCDGIVDETFDPHAIQFEVEGNPVWLRYEDWMATKGKTKYEVWCEGSFIQGDERPTPAQFLGTHYGKDFKEACQNAMEYKGWEVDKYYNEEKNTFWGCRFYDNETDARKAFG